MFTDAADTMSKNPKDENARLFSTLDQLPRLSQSLGMYRLRQCYPEIEDETNRCSEWVQTSNPATESIITGYKPINWVSTVNGARQPFGGLGLNKEETNDKGTLFPLIDDVPLGGNWWNNIGARQYHGPDGLLGRRKDADSKDITVKGITAKKVELYIAVLRVYIPCHALCSEGQMCDNRPGRNHGICTTSPPTCPDAPLVADTAVGCICGQSICARGESCNLAASTCSLPVECPAPAGRPDMLADYPDQLLYNTSEIETWEDLNVEMGVMPVLIKAEDGTVVGSMNMSIIRTVKGTVLGELDPETEDIVDENNAILGKVERWSNGNMVILEDGTVFGRLEERFIEGMNATFRCDYHYHISKGVS